MSAKSKIRVSVSARLVAAWLAWTVAGLSGCCTVPAERQGQMAFVSPEDAARVLVLAAKGGDEEDMLSILGPDAREVLSSGDPVADRNNREVFVIAYKQKWALELVDAKTRELVIGNEAWPFPIPLVKDCDGWRFDTVAGKGEVLARRIGRNELAIISVCQTYVIAQREYASQGHDGEPAGIYAQKVHSEPGMQDGLHWVVSSPEEMPSPLSELVAAAEAVGYSSEASVEPRPFHGYFLRILSQQGEAAPGGTRSYVVDGQMTGGFALIAYPATYGNSGIMTFTVNQDGVVYEADLGEDTSRIAAEITKYDPDARWSAVE